MTESNFNILTSKHKKLLPLSFNDLTLRKNEKPIYSGKVTSSVKYKDENYSLHKFYKPITRF